MRSGDSAHKALSLSVSDVSFLEEVVPTRYGHDDDGFSAFGFDDVPNGSPLPGKSPSSDPPLPAPLPPPPRSGITASNTTTLQLPLPSPASKIEDDIWDVFAAPPSTQLPSPALPSHLLTQSSAIPPTRFMGPSSNTPPTVPRRSITPKMVSSTLSTGTVPSLLPPPARSMSALAVQKTLITNIPQIQQSPSSPLSAGLPLGSPYLDETTARSHDYVMKPHMYDTPPPSSGPDEAFDLFDDFTNSTPKSSMPTHPPTPPNKSPNRTYPGGSSTRGSLQRPGTTSQSSATRPASVSSSMLSASTRKGSSLNFDFLTSDTTKPNAQVSAVPHGNGIAPPIVIAPRSSQSPPLRPLSHVTAPPALAPSQGRVASPIPSAPSINLRPSFGTMPVAVPPTPPTAGPQGGLTAQDLSFFENL
ncbi:hypothetical protein BS47DRAFT_1152431 [Hydnum rufescens UP504]|uniref:Uncharacterized protein n=1 Tax=Hydnum rufescens UP504 TaxID=1448309 RepID=A0A9P6B857_9AGAM|nr:hypothetical protein BS47DRAFT_1152431 [Hydnum rufescens UP504]